MKFLILLLVSTNAIAAGSGHGSPSDLIPAAVNVTILLAAIVFGLRKKLSALFKAQSTSISELLERASAKAKEAEMLMELNKKKIEGAEEELNKKKVEMKNELTSFEKTYSLSIEERVKKMKEDAGSKIDAEKLELMNELNRTLIDQVISKTKAKIKTDKSLSDSAVERLVKGL